jgi:hypothetical protein
MVAGRVINLHAGVKRWYDVPLSLAESAEHGRELLIVVGPPHSGVNNCSTIDSLDIYGRRTRMLGLPKAAAAAAAAAASATLASVAATGAAVTNTASAAGANSASSVVARALSESAAAREATAALRFGATLLREAVRSELPASGALRDELCAVAASALRDVHLGATSAHADVRALLRALLPERSAQAAALDRALFLALAAALDAHGAHSHAAESPTQPDAALVSRTRRSHGRRRREHVDDDAGGAGEQRGAGRRSHAQLPVRVGRKRALCGKQRHLRTRAR